MKKLLVLLMALIMVVACFAGCSEEKKEDEKPAIIVGYTLYEPMNYEDENGKLVGFDTELAEMVFDGMGYKASFKLINWDNRYTELDSGAIDCIWNGFTANSKDSDGVARSEKVDFSYNYMENRQVIVVRTDSEIKTAADLNQKIGIAEAGSAGETYAQSFEGVVYKSALKQTDTLLDVKSKTADFAVVDAQLAKSYVGKGDYAELKIVEELSSDVEFYAIGFKKNSELTAKVNEQLEKLAADGTIATLAEKYGVQNTAITDFSDQK
ncbi:MAG: transporter substrate-binding domain-containing protein [Ruminococcaceae bacterium]|nr:transporter substrate-binding domain-containing protein [Oscillospiraceae bacterium]